MNTELQTMLDSVRNRKMTAEEIEEQRINFAFGNAADGDSGSIDSVRAASTILKHAKSDTAQSTLLKTA